MYQFYLSLFYADPKIFTIVTVTKVIPTLPGAQVVNGILFTSKYIISS